jgi:hypothetical protein
MTYGFHGNPFGLRLRKCPAFAKATAGRQVSDESRSARSAGLRPGKCVFIQQFAEFLKRKRNYDPNELLQSDWYRIIGSCLPDAAVRETFTRISG